MNICVLGSGPAALTSALLLKGAGYDVEVFGTPRNVFAIEGISTRTLNGLINAGFKGVQDLVGERYRRVSVWRGDYVEANGEFVIQRRAFDRLYAQFVKSVGVRIHEVDVHEVFLSNEAWGVRFKGDSAPEDVANRLFDFLVDARGGGAPKSANNLMVGPLSLSATCLFTNGKAIDDQYTYVEPFIDGWAWVVHHSNGSGSIQIVFDPENIKAEVKEISVIFNNSLSLLSTTLEKLGSGFSLDSNVSVRGFCPTLRGGVVSKNFIRVGDSCYSGDPLSGHGMFEAISGAFAALPVINTLLFRPENIRTAIGFYSDRAKQTFVARMKKGSEIYASETRWKYSQFWEKRSNFTSNLFVEDSRRPPGFYKEPVVENGYIVDRYVARSDSHPRGVRFIDGVDLYALANKINIMRPGYSMDAIASELCAPTQNVGSAYQWLIVNEFITPDLHCHPFVINQHTLHQ